MNPVQYIIADHTLNMSPGKLAAQVAHASQLGLRLNAKTEHGNPYDESIVNRWMLGGHYAKVVLEVDTLSLALMPQYLEDRGFKCAQIIDEGRTEFSNALTFTAIGLPVLDKDIPHVRETFSQFKLYGYADGQEEERRIARAVERMQADRDAGPKLVYTAPAVAEGPRYRGLLKGRTRN